MEVWNCITGRRGGLSFTSWLVSTVDAVARPSVLQMLQFITIWLLLGNLANKLYCFQLNIVNLFSMILKLD